MAKRRLSRPDLPPAKRIRISSAEEDVDYEESKAQYGLLAEVEYAGDYAKLSRSARAAARKKVVEERKKAMAEALRKQVEQARKQPRFVPKTDDKAFSIAFIQMGQGDCFVIFTPGGKIIMIDCGTTASEKKKEARTYKTDVDDDWSDQKLNEAEIPDLPAVELSQRVKAVLGTKNKIDYLILTHYDRDHYNQLKGLLEPMGIMFGAVYHSADLSNYSANATVSFIEGHVEADEKGNKQIFRVTHNDPNSKTITLTRRGETGKPDVAIDLPKAAKGYQLLDEDNCKIWFLASDVTSKSISGLKDPDTNDDSTDANRGSLVTLVEAFEKKILICGDATIVTEQYLLATSKDAFKDLDILQAPHHGTRLTSSSKAFVDHTNPLHVAVSSARKDQQHRLPQQETLRKYFLRMKASKRPLEEKAHEILYWMQGRQGSPIHLWSELKRPIYITGSQGSFGWTISRTGGNVKMEYGLIRGPADETKTTTSTEPEKMDSEGAK